MAAPVNPEVETTVRRILSALREVHGLPYDGEPVDQLQHALQCAALAREAQAGPNVVVAALLHDIGRSPLVLREVGTDEAGDHGEAARRWLSPLVGERVAWLAGQHVAAKRYLVATDDSYRDSLTEVSRRTLQEQGGPMSSEEVAAFELTPGWRDAAQLRRWDDRGKNPEARVPPLESYELELRSVIAGSRGARHHV